MDYNFSNIKDLGQSHCSLYYVLLQTGVFLLSIEIFSLPAMWLALEFSIPFSGKERGTGSELSGDGKWFNESCLCSKVPIKPPKDRGWGVSRLESLGIQGEIHAKSMGGFFVCFISIFIISLVCACIYILFLHHCATRSFPTISYHPWIVHNFPCVHPSPVLLCISVLSSAC